MVARWRVCVSFSQEFLVAWILNKDHHLNFVLQTSRISKYKPFYNLLVGVTVGLLVLAGLLFFRNHQPQEPLENIAQPQLAQETSSPENQEVIATQPTATTPFSPSPTLTPTSTPIQSLKYNVPFTAQAPFGDWDDSFQQDGCEEASALMAVYWAKEKIIESPEVARDIILELANWQQQNYLTGIDTSAKDTAERIIKQYLAWPWVEVQTLVNPEQIKTTLQNGSLIITPMDGRKLGNPYYTGVGPERHMLVVIGFSAETQEFITNDPGTRQGRDFRYHQDIFWNAIRDYPTGDHEPIVENNKVMIVVSK